MKCPVLIPLVLAATSCVTTAQRMHQAWADLSSSEEFQKEKALFKKRTGGKEFCATVGIYVFTWPNNSPRKDCIYTSGGYRKDAETNDITTHLEQLKVLQTTPKGFLIEHEYWFCPKFCEKRTSPGLIFVHKTDQEGIVDGAFLDPASDQTVRLYEYVGPYTYESVNGAPRTVHSFKVFPREVLKTSMEGFKVYDPNEELYASLKIWHRLEESLIKSRKMPKQQ